LNPADQHRQRIRSEAEYFSHKVVACAAPSFGNNISSSVLA